MSTDKVRLRYLREMVDLWDTLAEHSEWDKYLAAYSEQSLRHIMSYKNLCPACEYANTGFKVDCDKCAIEEWRKTRCYQGGLFCKWTKAVDKEVRSKHAKTIADLARENIKRLWKNESEKN
jgi:hypothetical protein